METCNATLLSELPVADAEFTAAGPDPEPLVAPDQIVTMWMPPVDIVPRCCQHRGGPPDFTLIAEWSMQYLSHSAETLRRDRWICYTCDRLVTREDIVREFGPPPSTLWCRHHGRRQAASIDFYTFQWTATCVHQGDNYCTAVPCTCVLEDIRENVAEVITVNDDDDDDDDDDDGGVEDALILEEAASNADTMEDTTSVEDAETMEDSASMENAAYMEDAVSMEDDAAMEHAASMEAGPDEETLALFAELACIATRQQDDDVGELMSIVRGWQGA